jgi:hypothetical protein
MPVLLDQEGAAAWLSGEAGLELLKPVLSAAAQDQIGRTTSVKPAAHGSLAGTLSVGAGVHANETIGTDSAGVAALRFRDETGLDVGPNSSVRLDRFIYNPNRGAGEVILNATRGSFRFTTGNQNSKAYKVKTPYGTLGVRG